MKLNDLGLTLVELLIGLTMFGIVLASIMKMFISMSAGYTTQNSVADLQQSIRAVMNLMIQEIRMTGFSSLSENKFGVTEAAMDKFSFTVDWDNDGLITASHSGDDQVPQESDIISYVFDRGQTSFLRRTAEGTSNVSTQPLLGGSEDQMRITDLTFSYYDQENQQTSILSHIRSIEVSVTAELPGGRKGLVSRSYNTRIKCRNLGL